MRHMSPTGQAEVFNNYQNALKYIKTMNYPIVIKADGLAKGKGVYIINNQNEAINTLKQIMQKKIFAAAGEKIIIEEYLQGEEFTVLSFIDSNCIKLMPLSRDHKKLLDNDKGPNTGGMGAFAPIKLPKMDLRIYYQSNNLSGN